MSESLFTIVKPSCVGLLGSANLTPSSIPSCLQHINELANTLCAHSTELPQLSPSLVSYIFFPVSSILQRNAPSTIPDQILEKMLVVLDFLSESWWWHCEIMIWEQIFMLCGSVLGGMANKGKGKERGDEVKEAAAKCLYTLLRDRDSDTTSIVKAQQAKSRLAEFRDRARSKKFIPIFGQTLNAILAISESRSFSLQRASLQVIRVLLETYTSDEVFPMVLPGVVSTMSKIALGTKLEKQWANGEVVADAISIIQIVVVRSVGDNICIKEGALRNIDNLEDLVELVTPSATQPSSEKVDPPQPTRRTPTWLKGTTSQLHIAINNLNVLTAHPSPIALRAFASFAKHVLEATPRSLPQSQPLLLAFLLSISNSSFTSVSSEAHAHLVSLLSSPSEAHPSLVLTLMRNTREYLSALPRLISIQAEGRVRHLAGLIEAVCRLAFAHDNSTASSTVAITKGIGKLLGPNGGIEKWGWGLLSVFEFSEAPVALVHTSTENLMLENDPDSSRWTPFPELRLKTAEVDTLQALEKMLRALGSAGGDPCLYSVEWFIGIGKVTVGMSAVSAMWCACRLLEGVSCIDLSCEVNRSQIPQRISRRLERLARSLARTLPELWDQQVGDTEDAPPPSGYQGADDMSLVEHKKGLDPVHESLKIIRSSPAIIFGTPEQPINHRAVTLQLLSVCVGILQSHSSSLFIHVLYPVLHSLVSQVPFLASTAYTSLQFMTYFSSYASPANLLLSNFDYALDAISRRLTRRWIDVDATKVLVILVHLVGSDIAEKAGDVVEECFDRLDEFHGYDILVEGLVNVLTEVTKALKDEVLPSMKRKKEPTYTPYPRLLDLSAFFEWYRKRHDFSTEFDNKPDYGPAPRRAWGTDKRDDEETEEAKKKAMADAADPNEEPTPTQTQMLTKQIVSRSLYFLTHGSPAIRTHILTLLASSASNLPASALMPAIHSAWPFILNRLGDQETFVVSAAAALVETLSVHMGEFMFRRIWDDVWPRFKKLLTELQVGDENSALMARGGGTTNTGSAYTHSHRLYRSLLNTMTAALQDVHPHMGSFWDVLVLLRRFLDQAAHPDLQRCARRLYKAAMVQDTDSVWLVLMATSTQDYLALSFLHNRKWDIIKNAHLILDSTPVE